MSATVEALAIGAVLLEGKRELNNVNRGGKQANCISTGHMALLRTDRTVGLHDGIILTGAKLHSMALKRRPKDHFMSLQYEACKPPLLIT